MILKKTVWCDLVNDDVSALDETSQTESEIKKALCLSLSLSYICIYIYIYIYRERESERESERERERERESGRDLVNDDVSPLGYIQHRVRVAKRLCQSPYFVPQVAGFQ